RDALQRCVRDGLLPPGDYPVQLDAPKQAAHGDFAANAAMTFAKPHAAATGAKKPDPRALAQAIVERIEDREGMLAGKPEIAGPGFLNIRLAPDVWHKALRAVWDQRERFGRSDAGLGLRTMVEFVSANPTGPMHVGHGRGAVIGDVVANLLEWAGYQVFREFYINDAGGQVGRLAHAVLARATELRADVPRVPLDPEDYQGEYVKDVARAWLDAGGDPSRPFSEIREPLRKFATTWILKNLIEEDLRLFGIRFDSFFSEKLLHDQDRLSAAIRLLEEKGMTAMEVLPPPKGVDIDEEEYVPQPLKVVKTTRFGDDRDRPLLKTRGEFRHLARAARDGRRRRDPRVLPPAPLGHGTGLRLGTRAETGQHQSRLLRPVRPCPLRGDPAPGARGEGRRTALGSGGDGRAAAPRRDRPDQAHPAVSRADRTCRRGARAAQGGLLSPGNHRAVPRLLHEVQEE